VEKRRIFIVGDTLFAETLTQLLAHQPAVEIAGSASDLLEALPLLPTCDPDVVIVARVASQPDATFARFLSACPQLPVICLDLSSNDLQVIVSQRLVAHSSNDLLVAIASMPKRSYGWVKSTFSKGEA
jgi:chemotaxis response regulator CheB